MLAALLVVAFTAPASAGAAPPPEFAPGPFMPAYRSACIRDLREFAWALSSAVESGDVNRFAALYRWQGLSTRAGYDTMSRLQAIVARPLLEVAPVYPRRAEPAFALAESDGPASATGIDSPYGHSAIRVGGLDEAGEKVFPPPTGPAMFEVPLPVHTAPAIAGGDPSATGPAGLPDSTAPRSPPVGLRLDQTLADGVTPAPTTLRLRRDQGCWWVSL
jgi:hypothetical protein